MPGLQSVPAYGSEITSSQLAPYGYVGRLGQSEWDKRLLDYSKSLAENNQMLGGLQQSMSFLGNLLNNGSMNPYQQSVVDAARAESMRSYDDMARALATKFSALGGYFGGGHSVAQSRLATDAANALNKQIADLLYQGYSDDMTRRLQASQLMGLQGQTGAAINQQIFDALSGAAGTAAERERYDIGQYQAAMDKAYQDWLRGRGELTGMMDLARLILGTQAYSPYAVQTDNWLAQLIGTIGGAALLGK